MCLGIGSNDKPKLPSYESVKTPQVFGRRGIFDFGGAQDPRSSSSPQFATPAFNPYSAATAANRKSFLGA